MRNAMTCAFAAVLLGAGLVHSQEIVEVRIDVASNRHSIDARIYGVAFADPATIAELRVPLNRWGGNAASRYNWQVNASNRAADWFFESIPDGTATAGDAADTFIATSKSAGAEPLLTIPMVGWVAKLGPTRGKLASFSIAKYGPQTGADAQSFPDAGNGTATFNGQPIKGNDPNDASVVANAMFQQDWVRHLVSRWDTAENRGLLYYILDNEPSLWHVTHRDVHPTGSTMDEVKNAFINYSARIKAVDGSALIVGPEEWGWSGYFHSGYDQQWGARTDWRDLPDRTAHDGWDYLPWFLDQMHGAERSTGTRLLDVFSVHYYPQGGEFGDDTSVATQLRRNRSTRSLWDPNYVDESWIGAVVRLVPRLRYWVDTCYPGTKIGITEYNWGAEGHINGATAQADILGIFGREALDVATRWVAPGASTPTYKAFKLYRNYDGVGSSFGDISVSSVTPDPDALAVFAAQRSTDGALTVMAVNKGLSGATIANIHVANFAAGQEAQVWQLTSSNTIARLGGVASSSSTLTARLPAQSITLFVVPTISAPIHAVASAVTATAGTPQTATVSTAFPTALQAVVQDAVSNPVTGVTVTFTTPVNGPSARFSGAPEANAVTNASGVATAPSLTANGTAGSYVVSASVATSPPARTSMCGVQTNDEPIVFCDTFDRPFPVTTRSGQLDGTIWGVSRTIGVGGNNFGQGTANQWPATLLQQCDGTTPRVIPPNDVIVCNGQLREATNDNVSGGFEAGDVTVLAMYPKQPFDFAGRTGTVAFDVSNDTHSIHSAWPEFWVTDLPSPAPFTHFGSWIATPRNGFGVRFGAAAQPGQIGLCPNRDNLNVMRWTVDSAVVIRNYQMEDTTGSGTPTGMQVTPLDCVISPAGVGVMNHVEVRISQNQIDVYATDAGTTAPLKHLAVITQANLGLTRGLIWLEDVHYNADKGDLPSQREHTFAWDNVAFDGPFTYRDLSYDALDALVPSTNGSVNLGKFSGANQVSSWNVLNLPANPQAEAVRVLFNVFHYDPPTVLNVMVNGQAHATGWLYPDINGFTWRTVAVTIPITDLVAGTNVVTIGGDQPLITSNVDIVLVDARTVVAGSTAAPTSVRQPLLK